MNRPVAAAMVALLAASAACEYERAPPPDFGRTPEPPPPEPLPTPEPPAEGAWALAVVSTGEDCGFAAPPEVVYLAGDGREWQVTLQPFFLDATGVLDGDDLTMTGTARVALRPTVDCVIEERDTWTLRRVAPETLTGELARTRERLDGDECPTLPCLTRWQVRLDHRSAKRAP